MQDFEPADMFIRSNITKRVHSYFTP